MIAFDTSSLIAFLAGHDGDDVTAVDQALKLELAVLPPTVLTEMLSLPDLEPSVFDLMNSLPLLTTSDGFWRRAADNRRKVLTQGRRARLADTLIAQSCIDHGVPLVTRDSDFGHFADFAALQLV